MKTILQVEIETKDNYNITVEDEYLEVGFHKLDAAGQKEWAEGFHKAVLGSIKEKLDPEEIVTDLLDAGCEFCLEGGDDNSFYKLKIKVK